MLAVVFRDKRELATSLLSRVGLVSLTLAARRRLRPRTLTVINYHRVDDPESAAQFDEGTLDVTPQAFDRQVGLLCREFTLLDPDALRELVRGHRWPSNPALITFDDGYRDNYERALPILQRHGAKAIFFVATHFVQHRRLFWWDRINYTLKRAQRSHFSLGYPRPQEINLASGVGKPTNQLLRLVKDSFGLDLDRFLGELTQAAEVPWSDALEQELADRLIMTWDQVRALGRAGMRIGSHTRRHRVLTTLPQAELVDELVGSRTELEAVLGEPVWAIAYPVGSPVAQLPAIRAILQDAGYELGFSYGTGTQPLRRLDPLSIRRMAVDADWSEARFGAAVTFPRLG
jgi:peptidoglycan/xylan/chitin deacetylase (PgdA/CDA1 family)